MITYDDDYYYLLLLLLHYTTTTTLIIVNYIECYVIYFAKPKENERMYTICLILKGARLEEDEDRFVYSL